MREATAELEGVQRAMFEALTDLYAILPLGFNGERMVPLLRKRKRTEGLTGAALDRAVEHFIARVPHARGSRLN